MPLQARKYTVHLIFSYFLRKFASLTKKFVSLLDSIAIADKRYREMNFPELASTKVHETEGFDPELPKVQLDLGPMIRAE